MLVNKINKIVNVFNFERSGVKFRKSHLNINLRGYSNNALTEVQIKAYVPLGLLELESTPVGKVNYDFTVRQDDKDVALVGHHDTVEEVLTSVLSVLTGENRLLSLKGEGRPHVTSNYYEVFINNVNGDLFVEDSVELTKLSDMIRFLLVESAKQLIECNGDELLDFTQLV